MTLFIVLTSSFGWARTWTSAEVNHIFDRLYSEGALAASAEVETFGVSSYDFGMDLLSMKEMQRALTWYTVQSQINHDPNFLFGKAWIEMEMDNLLVAMQTANALLDQVEGLAKARAHYLLGVIHLKGGSEQYARNELDAAIQLYQELGKDGGVRLCERLFASQKSRTVNQGADPPRDDDDS